MEKEPIKGLIEDEAYRARTFLLLKSAGFTDEQADYLSHADLAWEKRMRKLEEKLGKN